MNNRKDSLSIFISLILRHKPETINIVLDNNGYASVGELINGVNASGRHLTLDILENIVATDNKGRYSFNSDKTKIRANQGHSIKVDVELKEKVPPEFLYHGTGERNINNIINNGIKKMKRIHVHLSDNLETAITVGKRHGKPIVFKINTARMINDGYKFYLSENGVWLTDFVPNDYISNIGIEGII